MLSLAHKELFETITNGIDEDWKKILQPLFEAPTGQRIIANIISARKSHIVYPPNNLIFNALKLTKFNSVKVIILGQDPYHGPGQANGLSFSVPPTMKKLPPSLIRILQEAGVTTKNYGNLENWAKQGVLMLNTTLTVEAGKPNSHVGWGWNIITDKLIYDLSKNTNNRQLVFMLWGTKAHECAELIDERKHVIIKTSHPSPLATKGNFVGSKCFDKCNDALVRQNLLPIDWTNLFTACNVSNEEQIEVDAKLLPESFKSAINAPKKFIKKSIPVSKSKF